MIVRLAAGFAGDVAMTGVVPKFSRTPGAIRTVGPALGEHTDVVLRELAGCGDDEIAALTRRWRRRVSALRRIAIGGSPRLTGGCSAETSSCARRWSSSVNARVVEQNSTMIPLGSLA